MHLNERVVLTGAILFGLGLVAGIAIGSATAVSALTQGAPDVLQSWSGYSCVTGLDRKPGFDDVCFRR